MATENNSTNAPQKATKSVPGNDNRDQPKSLADQALNALRNAKRAEKNGNQELAEKHNKNALSLAYESGKTGEDTGKFKPATHPELIASHARGVESIEISERAAKFREAEKNISTQVVHDRADQHAIRFSEPNTETKPLPKQAAPKGLDQNNFAERDGNAKRDPDKERQSKILQQINREYSGSNGKYYQYDNRGNQRLAFQDAGSKIVAQNNDQKVAFTVAAMAEAKGWSQVRVSGHSDFRRNVWLEAKSRGLDVKGYIPNDHDKAALQERLDAKKREAKPPKAPKDTEKAGGTVAPVVKAVAEAVVKNRVRNPDSQKKILDRINERQKGKNYSVPTYDLKAPQKTAQAVDRTASRTPNTERTR